MQPYGVSDNDFVCRPDAYNQVLGWCNVTDTPTGPQPTDLYVLPDGPEPGMRFALFNVISVYVCMYNWVFRYSG